MVYEITASGEGMRLMNWVPLTEQLLRDWGNDFVPSDIADNIVIVREFLDQQPAPHPRMLDLLREIRVEGKSISEYLQYYDGLIADVHEAFQHLDESC